MDKLSPKEMDLLFRYEKKEGFRIPFLQTVRGLKWFDHLHQRDCFNPSTLPKPEPTSDGKYFRIVSWPITEYLVKTAPELAEEPSLEHTRKFLDVLVSTTEFAVDNEITNYRVWWQFAKIIRHIPIEAIDHLDLKIVDYWLDDPYDTALVAEEIGEGWLPQLIEDGGEHARALATRLIGLLYQVRLVDQAFGGFDMKEASFRIDSDSLRDITQKIASQAGGVLGRECLAVFHTQLSAALLGEGSDAWSELWQPAIEDHQQNEHCDECTNILVKAYRDALLGYVTQSPVEARQFLNSILSDQYQTVRRIAIYVITEEFGIYRNLLKEILSPEYFVANYRHEVWGLLHRYYKEFSAEERAKVKEIVLDITCKDEDGKPIESGSAYERATWLAAIRSLGSEEEELYRREVAVAGIEPDHPSFSSVRRSGPVVRNSPVPLEAFAGMEVEQIIELLAVQDANTPRQDIEGMSGALREAVKTSPLKFQSQLSGFLDLRLTFVRQVVEAYRELWAQHEELPWGQVWPNLLKFCLNLVSREEFWCEVSENPIEMERVDRYEILRLIPILIEDGTKSDTTAFDAENLPAAERILSELLRQEPGEEYEIGSDAVTFAINSPRGRTLLALINLTLRSCRLADQVESHHRKVWERFEPVYDSEFQRAATENEYEFITLIAKLLPNFLYMSSIWTLRNLGRVFDRENQIAWRCAMEGYSRVKPVYKRVFEFLKREKHFRAALDDEQLDDQVRKGVIRNICAAYVSDIEDLSHEDSLMGEIISRGHVNELSLVIWVIWTMRNSEVADLPGKVLVLWSKILNQIDVSLPEHRRLASKLCMWCVFVERVDDTSLDLILRVARFAEVDHNSRELLRSIARISESQPFKAADIWSEMLKESTPVYPQDALQEFLENLSAAGPEGIRRAKEIVSCYLRAGIEGPNNLLSGVSNQKSPSESL